MTKKTIKKLCVPAIYFLIFVIAFTLATGQAYADDCESDAIPEQQILARINYNNGPNFIKINTGKNDNGKIVLHTDIMISQAGSVCLSANGDVIEDLKLEEDSLGRLNIHCRKGQIAAAENYTFNLVVQHADDPDWDFVGDWFVTSP